MIACLIYWGYPAQLTIHREHMHQQAKHVNSDIASKKIASFPLVDHKPLLFQNPSLTSSRDEQWVMSQLLFRYLWLFKSKKFCVFIGGNYPNTHLWKQYNSYLLALTKLLII